MNQNETSNSPSQTGDVLQSQSILGTGKGIVSSTKETVMGFFGAKEKVPAEGGATGKEPEENAAAEGASSQSSLFEAGKAYVAGAADTGKSLIVGATDAITGFLSGQHSEQVVSSQVDMDTEGKAARKCTNPSCKCVDCKCTDKTDSGTKVCQDPNCTCADCTCAVGKAKKCGNVLCGCEDCQCAPGACDCGK